MSFRKLDLPSIKRQLAVYHGQQLDSIQTRCGDGGKNRVYMYPQEYLTYGVGSSAMVITRADGEKEYKVVDHLGSTRAVVDGGGNVIGRYDNAPFGEQIAVTGVGSRKQFSDQEKDSETNQANHGVRSYSMDRGQFMSIDPLWEKYRGLSPYSYSANNPLKLVDKDGQRIKFASEKLQARYMEALEFLERKGVAEAFVLRELLEDESFTIYVDSEGNTLSTSGGASNYWRSRTQTLYWAPLLAMEYENEDGEIERLSPAITLLHEATHAWLEKKAPWHQKALDYKTDNAYENGEEEWIIKQAEYPAAKQAHGVGKVRTAWVHQDALKRGSFYLTLSPISIEKAQPEGKEK